MLRLAPVLPAAHQTPAGVCHPLPVHLETILQIPRQSAVESQRQPPDVPRPLPRVHGNHLARLLFPAPEEYQAAACTRPDYRRIQPVLPHGKSQGAVPPLTGQYPKLPHASLLRSQKQFLSRHQILTSKIRPAPSSGRIQWPPLSSVCESTKLTRYPSFACRLSIYRLS